jgi:UDPglucose 6-dehydrogenase
MTCRNIPLSNSFRIAVFGCGYVGLTTAVCLASIGHTVRCVDSNPTLVNELREGNVSLAEPGITELIRQGLTNSNLVFGTCPSAAVDVDYVFLCLPTPAHYRGSVDTDAIHDTVTTIREVLAPGTTIVTKSTVPVGTARMIRNSLFRDDIAVAANPEFLREGHAVYDFMHPARIVVGADNDTTAHNVAAIYHPIRTEIILTDTATAELAKYAGNAYLATRLAYINTIAELCEKFGADINDLTRVLRSDTRIGLDFLHPGPGWGGPCLPKDTQALLHQASRVGVEFPIIDAALRSNDHHSDRVAARLRSELGGSLHGLRVAILGLTFKAGTSDLRNSPATRIAKVIIAGGASVIAYDPAVDQPIDGINVAATPFDAAARADAVLVLTEWPQFSALNWRKIAELMSGQTILDTRNIINRTRAAESGLRVVSLGHGLDQQHPHASG